MSRLTLTRRVRADNDYLELVRQFPLRPLRARREHLAAQVILSRMLGRENLTRGQTDYLAALARFVSDYEKERGFFQSKKLPPLEILRDLLEENRMTTSDLGDVIGSRGLASEILRGKRGMSKAVIRKLAKRFCVEPGLFLEP
jgi:HTH-type transcriptional regulator / antitoxin HigA